MLHSLDKSPARELADLFHLVHLPCPTARNDFPFSCPGCGKVFVNNGDVVADQPWKDAKKYTSKHMGMKHKRPPLLCIEPRKYCPCTLHLLLNITKTLFHSCITINVRTKEQEDAVNLKLQQLDICCKNVVRTTGTGEKSGGGKPVKFIGRDAKLILHHAADFVDIVGGSDAWKQKRLRKLSKIYQTIGLDVYFCFIFCLPLIFMIHFQVGDLFFVFCATFETKKPLSLSARMDFHHFIPK